MTLYLYLLLGFYLLVFIAISFGVFFSDVEAGGMQGCLSLFLFDTIPKFIGESIRTIGGEATYIYILEWFNYFTKKKNPLFQLTYLLILNGAYIGWLTTGQPQLPTLYIKEYHKYIAFFGIVICHFTFYIACTADAGHITRENIHRFLHSPYDGILSAFCHAFFHSNTHLATLKSL